MNIPGLAAALILLVCPVVQVGAQRTSSVAGTVSDSAGHAIARVEVTVLGAGVSTLTDEHGAYHLGGLVAGPARVAARRLGYRAVERSVDLDAARASRLDIALSEAPEILSAVEAVAAPQVYDARLAGFNARSQQKVGHFLTRERIERANSTSLSDMLREIPGLRVGSPRNEGRSIRLRGATCAPLVFVDGFPAAAGEFDVDMIDVQSVEGVEVYSGLSSIPPEFSGPRDLSRCGVIAIWSAPSRPRRRVEPARSAEAPPIRAKSSDEDIRTRDQVDEAAHVIGSALDPRYPDSLLATHMAGRVVVEFVVDTIGGVEPASIEILAASNPLFATAVTASLRGAHFAPAIVAGRKVRQYVQLPFSFAMRDSLPRP